MRRAAEFLVRRRNALVAIMLVVTALASWRALRLEFDFSFRTFFVQEPEDELATTFAARFQNLAGSYLVAVLQGDDVFRPDVLAALADMTHRVEKIGHVEHVYSLASVPFVYAPGDELSFEPISTLVADGVPAATLRPDVLASPLYLRRLVSPDGTTTAVLALVEDSHRTIAARAPTIAAFEDSVRSTLPPGFSVLFTGYPITEAEYAKLVLSGFGAAQLVGTALMAIALWLSFRAVPAVVLPLITVGIATVISLGLMELTGQRLTFTNASVPLLMLVIGVSENSFLIARYYEEISGHGWSPDAAVNATAEVLWPALIAAATTAAAFFGLGAGHLEMTRDFGFNMALGGLAAFIVTMVVTPGTLARLGPPSARALATVSTGPITRFLAWVATFNARHSLSVGAAMLAVCVFGLVGMRRIVLEQYATRELPATHSVRRAQEVVDERLAGAFQVTVGVRAADGGVLTRPETLRAVDRLQDFLKGDPQVRHAWSVVDYVKEMHRAVGGAVREVPQSRNLIAKYLLMIPADAGSDLDSLLDGSEMLGVVALGITDIGTGSLRALAERADRFVRDQLGDALQIRFGGDYWQIQRGNHMLAYDQLLSTVTAFLFVLPFVAIFLRSWKLTLLTLPPNIVPLLAAAGIMGFAGFPLRTATSIILPVTIGVAIDTTTHIFAFARAEWRRGASHHLAARRAVLETGRGIISSTVALVAGFLAYQVPAFQSFHHVGILGSLTFLVALAANLFLTPVLLVWLEPFGSTPRQPGDDAAVAPPPRQASR